MQQLLKVGGRTYCGDVCYNVSCVSTGVQVDLLDQVRVGSDIQELVEVETVPSSKDQLQNVLEALRMDDNLTWMMTLIQMVIKWDVE